MIFLFEEFAYSEKFLQDILPLEKKGGNWDLPKGFVTKSKSGDFVLDGVGYLYNKLEPMMIIGKSEKLLMAIIVTYLVCCPKKFGVTDKSVAMTCTVGECPNRLPFPNANALRSHLR